jgi:3-methyl-2-oxobutanoate hydroxymethyltransferase
MPVPPPQEVPMTQAAATSPPAGRLTVTDFATAKAQKRRLVMITAYDFPLARLCDAAGVDLILVGDSLGMVVQGQADCLGVTLEDVIYHSRWTVRGSQRALVVADLPFMTYQVSSRQALKSAGRLIQEGLAQAVKLEGGVTMAASIRRITQAGIPVMGHVGLTPQSVNALGGFRVQRDEDRLMADALAVEEAGAFAVVIECVPSEAARKVTARLRIPTIGIGAGPSCDGQVLVGHDLLGLYSGQRPKFAKAYADLGSAVTSAVSRFCREVREGQFPGPEHEFH